MVPSACQRARSPVLYILAPASVVNGSGTNRSADVKLSCHAYWRWLPLLSQNVGASIRNRPSYRYASRLFCHSINFVSYRKGGRFSGAISVEQVLWAITI